MAIDVDRSAPLNLKLGRDWSDSGATYNQSPQVLGLGLFAGNSDEGLIARGRHKVSSELSYTGFCRARWG